MTGPADGYQRGGKGGLVAVEKGLRLTPGFPWKMQFPEQLRASRFASRCPITALDEQGESCAPQGSWVLLTLCRALKAGARGSAFLTRPAPDRAQCWSWAFLWGVEMGLWVEFAAGKWMSFVLKAGAGSNPLADPQGLV